MATSLGIILILGLVGNILFTRLKLPGLLGMLLVGVVIGPYGLSLLSHETLLELGDFRTIALIIILLRAGLGLAKEQLQRVGKAAIKMSFLPGLIEGFTIAGLSMWLLDFSFVQGGILGFIIAAVSPAVVVPRMLAFAEQGLGMKRGVPTLVLAGASVDDVVAITFFSAFMGIATAGSVSITKTLVSIPVSIGIGIGIGVITGIALVKLFRTHSFRDSNKVVILLSISFLLIAFQNAVKQHIEIAALLGVMTMGIVLLELLPEASKRIARKLNSIWVGAEILLFVLVGAQVDPRVAVDAGGVGIVLIAIGLIARSLGVWISTAGTDFSKRERLFALVSYTPKATVQAAIGAVPLEAGIESGNLILAIAVLSILITAPVGAIAINHLAPRCLSRDE